MAYLYSANQGDRFLSGSSVSLYNGAAGAAELRFYETEDSTTYYTGFKAGNQTTENSIYTMPLEYPASSKVLQSTDAGVLSWVAGGGLSGLGSTDNVLIRTNGTDGDAGQATGITVADSNNNMSGVGTLGCGAITSTGIIKTDDSTAATSTTDGSLQTDGGLSVVGDAVIGDDLILISDAAILKFGVGADVTFTHDNGTGMDIVSAGDLDLSSTAGNVTITSAVDEEGSIYIRENTSGTDGTIKIHADTGTGVNAKAGSTDASIALLSDAGGIGLYSALNGDNAITIEANGGTNETIQIRSNQGTGVATAAIANAVNASIALVSDVGGVALASGLNGEGAIRIEADGGANETVMINANQGTGVNAKGGSTDASINLVSDVGGIGLYTALNGDNAITLETNGGANETIQIRSNQGTGVATAAIANQVNASIALVSDVGGVALASGLNGDGSIWLEADGGANETIVVHSNQGTGANTATNAANASVSLYSDVGGVGLYSGLNAVNAITIEANGGTSENIRIHSNQGTATAAGAAALQLTADVGQIQLLSNIDGDAILLHSNGGTSAEIKVHNDQGTGDDSINIISDDGGVKLTAGGSDGITMASGVTFDQGATIGTEYFVTASQSTKGSPGYATGSFTITDGDNLRFVAVSASTDGAASMTITLPTAADNAGRVITIKDIAGNCDDNVITIDGEGSETVDGKTSIKLDSAYASVSLISIHGVLAGGSPDTSWHIF